MWKNMICFLVDDDPDDQEIFMSALQELNESIQCVTANNGVEALEKLDPDKSFVPDFIFLDLNMPMMDGKQCLAEIKKIPSLSHVPIVIYSTSSSPDDINETRRLGVSSFLTKPSSFSGLIKLLDIFFESQKVLKQA